jgi:hypothetical protein
MIGELGQPSRPTQRRAGQVVAEGMATKVPSAPPRRLAGTSSPNCAAHGRGRRQPTARRHADAVSGCPAPGGPRPESPGRRWPRSSSSAAGGRQVRVARLRRACVAADRGLRARPGASRAAPGRASACAAAEPPSPRPGRRRRLPAAADARLPGGPRGWRAAGLPYGLLVWGRVAAARDRRRWRLGDRDVCAEEAGEDPTAGVHDGWRPFAVDVHAQWARSRGSCTPSAGLVGEAGPSTGTLVVTGRSRRPGLPAARKRPRDGAVAGSVQP